jgi:SAM-dependent methyltransferase
MFKSRQNKFNFFFNEVCGGNWQVTLDVGVADVEFSSYDNFLEKYCPCPDKLTALSIYPLEHFKANYPEIKTVVYSGGRFPFSDNSFDVIHCNAVIEHVGDFEKQVEFVKEISRCSNRFYLTTPSKLFPFEMHTNLLFLHYLPKYFFDKLLCALGKGWAAGEYMHLLSKSDLYKILNKAQISNARIITKRFFGIPLHYCVVGIKE